MASLSGKLPNIRKMYAAQRMNHVLVGADYQQGELWVGYALTGDEALGTALKSSDVYTEIGKALFGLPKHLTKCECKVKPCALPDQHIKTAARHQSKIGYLAWRYACTFSTWYSQMLEGDQSLSLTTADLIYKGLGWWDAGAQVAHGTFKHSVEWWQEEMARVQATGHSESRVLHIRKAHPAPPTLQEVVNWPVQTTMSEVHALAWITLGSGRKGTPGLLATRFGGHALLVKQFYDAFLVECPLELVDAVSATLREAMEQQHEIEGKVWSFKVDVGHGRRESDA